MAGVTKHRRLLLALARSPRVGACRPAGTATRGTVPSGGGKPRARPARSKCGSQRERGELERGVFCVRNRKESDSLALAGIMRSPLPRGQVRAAMARPVALPCRPCFGSSRNGPFELNRGAPVTASPSRGGRGLKPAAAAASSPARRRFSAPRRGSWALREGDGGARAEFDNRRPEK